MNEDSLALTGAFEGVILKKSESGVLTLDVSALESAGLTIVAGKNKRVVPLQGAHPCKIGDVLGTNYKLPENLERLKGWMVIGFNENGIPKALEPLESAPEKEVTWSAAQNHVQQLRNAGHKTARLWTVRDSADIAMNVLGTTSGRKAGFKHETPRMNDSYWGNESSDTPDFVRTGFASEVGYACGTYSHVDTPNPVRCIQDMPELQY